MLLMMLRGHYCIDFYTAIAFTMLVHRLAEKLSFFPDVKLVGFKAKDRKQFNHTPCFKCGWSNENPDRLTDQKEIIEQKKLFNDNNFLLQHQGKLLQ
jgi:hypothetical protein